jgi:predicted AlkP superfamily phosphohydrolase/phosphomutase
MITQEKDNVVKEELIDIYKNLKYNGKKVIKKIFSKEEIYHGPYLKNAPDLVLLPNSGFCLRGGINQKPIFEHDDIIKGMHTQHDAFLYVKDKANKDLIPENPTVEDVVPIMNRLEKNYTLKTIQ